MAIRKPHKIAPFTQQYHCSFCGVSISAEQAAKFQHPSVAVCILCADILVDIDQESDKYNDEEFAEIMDNEYPDESDPFSDDNDFRDEDDEDDEDYNQEAFEDD